MKSKDVSSYRWIIILAIVPIIISTEMMWLSLSPISSIAEKYYGVSSMSVAMFATSYMIMYILFSLPASWVVDKFGYRCSLIIGAVLTAVFGLTRAIFVDNFTIALVSQFFIAIGQPFLLNISTKVPANWFPVSERSTAAGILIMAQYLGFVVPMVVAPTVASSSGIPEVFMLFAVIAIISAVIAIAFTRERPSVIPPGPAAAKEEFSAGSMKKLFTNKAYISTLFICFVSMGVFNTILSLIEPILTPRGITSVQAGIIGAVFVVAGVIGAVVVPVISDKLHKRVPIFMSAVSLLIPLYLGLTYVKNFTMLCIVAGAAGFVVMGVAPVLFQHGSEVAYPVQEGTSLGVILLMGQISGILFVYIFEALSGTFGSMILPMLIIVAVSAVQLPFAFTMKESDLVKK